MLDSLAKRVRRIKDRPYKEGNIVYWMSREHRTGDNWSLIYAMEVARSYGAKLCVAFCLPPEYIGASIRQYRFMVDGLRELPARLGELGIGFRLLEGYPEVELPSFLFEAEAGLLAVDFDPLIVNKRWKRRVAGAIDIAMHEVDAHNIVPCWLAAQRRIATYDTFRARIMPQLTTFLTPFPELRGMESRWDLEAAEPDWEGALERCKVDRSVPLVDWLRPGESEGLKALDLFCQKGLFSYKEKAMDPVVSAQSDLSPYLHFGQVSAQRVARDVIRAEAPAEEKDDFLDHLIVMRELADNFCLHTPEYDTIGAFPIWARRSLDEHRNDPREHLYTLEEFERGATHDPLWNAAQTELVKTGKIRGSLRAYWASKILEWSKRPEDALVHALYLNDRYSLDGNDPNGYTGIAMVIGGLYGRPWRSKEVIGKLRKLSYTQERIMHDLHAYYERVKEL
jgi:deoxyribodipyrimidine photo-lyase